MFLYHEIIFWLSYTCIWLIIFIIIIIIIIIIYLFLFLFYFLFFYFLNWMILFLLFLLHGSMEERFSRDLKEHSTQDGYEKGKKERDGKV